MIGAISLSDQAKELEDAAKREQEAYIAEHHADMIRHYENVSEGILKWLGVEDGPQDGEEVLEFAPEENAQAEEEVLECPIHQPGFSIKCCGKKTSCSTERKQKEMRN